MNGNSIKVFLVAVAAIAVILISGSVYVIDETQQVVITQFGRIVGEAKKEPGLQFKIPFIQKANYFPKNLLEWDGDPGQVPTRDKTYIWVDTYARWRITDPIVYFQTVKDEFAALKRLDDIIDPAVRDLISSYPLVESVRNTDRPMDTFEATTYAGGDEAEDSSRQMVRYKVDLGRKKLPWRSRSRPGKNWPSSASKSWT